MADCFISYRRVPSAAVATAIQAKLENVYGLDIYVDTTRTDSTRVKFPERLMQAIDDAPVFICLLGESDGQHTLDSEWVHKEIQRAYDREKFCIPVFQESYRPLPDMPPAVDYLLSFDGVHILDQKNIMIDESVAKLADLIRPRQAQRRSSIWVGTAALVALLGLALVAFLVLSNGGGGDASDETPTDGVVAAEASFTVAPSSTADSTDTPSDTPTATISPTETPTLSLTELENTVQAQMALIQTLEVGTLDAAATATADIERQYEQGTSEALTLTAMNWTPTPNASAIPMPTNTSVPDTAIPTLTLTPSPTETLNPLSLALTPVAHNADWTPIEQEFDGVPMVLVPVGCFEMGSTSEQLERAYQQHEIVYDSLDISVFEEAETPASLVCFEEPFWIDLYEVSNAQIGLATNGDLPYGDASWQIAFEHCTDRNARLPSEAEWEYAARGPDSLVYPWGDVYDPSKLTESVRNGLSIGSAPEGASWVGAMDMSGSVWEWTNSIFRPYPYDAGYGRESLSDQTSPRVIKGGIWDWDDRPSGRIGVEPSGSNSPYWGFRCAWDFDAP